MYIAVFFILGLVLGSFLNVLLFRLDREGGIILGRSKCPKCKFQLKWLDMIPLLSFILLKRRCRYCKERISLIYPVVELSIGLIFALFYIQLGFSFNISDIFQLTLVYFFIAIVFFDYLYYIIPDKIILPLVLVSLAFAILVRRPELMNLLISGLIFGGFFAILYVISKGKWIGLGDAKLSLLIGLSFGYPNSFFVVVGSIWTAALLGLILIVFKKASFKSELPFGSFLAAYSILLILYQHEIQKITYLFT